MTKACSEEYWRVGLIEIVHVGSRDRVTEITRFRKTICDRPGPSQVCILASWSNVSVAFAALVVLSNILDSPDLFDEYSRRQYQTRLPKHNPFGDEETPKKFSEFDVFTKVGNFLVGSAPQCGITIDLLNSTRRSRFEFSTNFRNGR